MLPTALLAVQELRYENLLPTQCLAFDQKPDYQEFIKNLQYLQDVAEEGLLDMTHATIIEKH